MLYTPNFCCNCGEAIDRADQKWTDSSRFCDVCKHDFVPQRALPAIFAVLMLFVGLAGAAGLMRQSDRNVAVTSRPAVNRQPANSPVPTPPAAVSRAPVAPKPTPPTRAPEVASDEYSVCGAMTKKGTPCSRRVRGGGRCWQHRGETVQNEASK